VSTYQASGIEPASSYIKIITLFSYKNIGSCKGIDNVNNAPKIHITLANIVKRQIKSHNLSVRNVRYLRYSWWSSGLQHLIVR